MTVTTVEEFPRTPAPAGFPTCRVCGCWEYDACWDDDSGACWWVTPDLCSHCAARQPSPSDSASPCCTN